MEISDHLVRFLVTERLESARTAARRRALVTSAGDAPVIRLARADDNAPIAAIWNREVVGTIATTDTEPRAPAAQAAWLAAHTEEYPVVVAAVGTEVIAFGCLSPYRAKPSYRFTVEDSVYVKERHRGSGLGSHILGELLAHARARGHRSVIARVTAENAPSLSLHRRHGFQRAGYECQVAFKLGRWLDVVTLQLLLSAQATSTILP
ncbi:MAG TPA: GNAT family N-acetyltransferase [Methylomirabilota bacterium]|nr:GNAT family N-acetyltransferase [Methylomirabilota bacterium]